MTDEYILVLSEANVLVLSEANVSDDGPGSDLFDPHEIGWWKPISSVESAPADQPCPNCNGEGYVVVRVYPWDGCSYDEVPCKFCNPYFEQDEIPY